MMYITDIVPIDKKKVKLYIDDKLFCTIYKGELRKLGLDKDDELTEELIENIYAILYKRARERSFYILKTRDYTEYELCTKLRRGYYPDEIIKKVINNLKEYGYIDDERFVENYISLHICKDSKRMIISKLYLKGISEELVKEKLSYCDMDSSKIILNKHIKLIEDIVKSDDKIRSKLISRLLRRGFTYEEITSAINIYKYHR